ncbi:MAG: hypothetical protein ABSG82_03755 [Sedimentisphaerales bacterium]|jgi:hypothetical protein
MTNGMFRVVLVAVAISAFAASAVFGAEANAPASPKPAPVPLPAPITVTGTVSVVKDANGIITAVKLTAAAEKVVHNVMLDKEGLKLGNEAAGKEVEVQAIKRGVSLKVLSFKVVEKAAEKPAEKPKQ